MSRESLHAQAFVPIIAERLGLELGTDFARLAFLGKVTSEAAEALDDGYLSLGISRHSADFPEQVGTTDHIAAELADVVMAAHTCAVAFGIDLDAAITEKLAALCERFGIPAAGKIGCEGDVAPTRIVQQLRASEVEPLQRYLDAANGALDRVREVLPGGEDFHPACLGEVCCETCELIVAIEAAIEGYALNDGDAA